MTSDLQGPPFCKPGQERLESIWRAGASRTSESCSGLVKKLGPSLWNTSSAWCTASRPLKVLVSKCQVCKMRTKQKGAAVQYRATPQDMVMAKTRRKHQAWEGLGQELMLQRAEAILKCSNTDSEDFLGQMEVWTMLFHSFYPWCISLKSSATSILYCFSLLETALYKLSLIKTSFFMCPQLIP